MFGILCFGASISWGRGELPNKGWVGRLKENVESSPYSVVYNLGVCGDTSQDLLARYGKECAARIQVKRPGDTFVILLGIGTNDARFLKNDVPQETPEGFRKNLLELIRISKEYPAKMVLLGLSPVDESKTRPYEETVFVNARIEEFNDVIRDCADSENVPFLDFFTLMKTEAYEEMLDDGLHPNAKGYEWMYERVREFLEKENMLS